MILDKGNIFSLDENVAATKDSAEVVDLGPGDAGPSESLSLFVSVAKPFSGSGSLAVALYGAEELDGANLKTPRLLATYQALPEAVTGGGKAVATRLPHGSGRYLRLKYTVSGALTGGEVTAGLVFDA